jgi:predicted peptidase
VYSIDRARIAVSGFSMGGAGSWHFAARYPERFSAAISVAGRPPESVSGWRLPILAIHSRDDQVMPIGPTETRIAELQKSGVHAKLIAHSDAGTSRHQVLLDELTSGRSLDPKSRRVWTTRLTTYGQLAQFGVLERPYILPGK